MKQQWSSFYPLSYFYFPQNCDYLTLIILPFWLYLSISKNNSDIIRILLMRAKSKWYLDHKSKHALFTLIGPVFYHFTEEISEGKMKYGKTDCLLELHFLFTYMLNENQIIIGLSNHFVSPELINTLSIRLFFFFCLPLHFPSQHWAQFLKWI